RKFRFQGIRAEKLKNSHAASIGPGEYDRNPGFVIRQSSPRYPAKYLTCKQNYEAFPRLQNHGDIAYRFQTYD
ncbi:MAG: hypothetical protein KGN84_21860, partial [Acidobacteriota bacterium]|nr:hypothetical protein [Acidobacteriota bacterium]